MMIAHPMAAFTKALTCLSKYGDELSIHATPDSLALSATNSSKSAYSRFKYERLFFSKYSVGAGETWANDFENAMTITGQLLTKVCTMNSYVYTDNNDMHAVVAFYPEAPNC